MATANFATFLTVPKALEFHQSVGPKYKEERLRYLRSIWVDAISENSNIENLGASDEASATGMGGFRLANKITIKENVALQNKLELEFNLFTVVRKGLASGANIRVTPQVYTHPDHMLALADALKTITK